MKISDIILPFPFLQKRLKMNQREEAVELPVSDDFSVSSFPKDHFSIAGREMMIQSILSQLANEEILDGESSEETDSGNVTDCSSLLQNGAYIDLVEQCASLITEFENYSSLVESKEARVIIEMMGKRLREALLISGAERIEGETEYNILRHIPVPMSLAPTGTPISQTLEPGIAIGNRVFVKAKVVLVQNTCQCV